MSRIVAGQLRFEAQPADLRDVILSALESVAPAAEAKSVQVQTELDSNAGAVRGDAARLQQIAWNLRANAIKFTSKGGRVLVALARMSSHVELTVSDSGMGIASDFLPYVFERFRQSDGGSTRRYHGLGLGLGIVKSLVEMHGGQVTAHSAGTGQGATFTVELPRWSSSRATVPLPSTRATRAPRSNMSWSMVGCWRAYWCWSWTTSPTHVSWLRTCSSRAARACSPPGTRWRRFVCCSWSVPTYC